MEKGELLGKGMTADVYIWGQDKVLKLYKEGYGEEWIMREAAIGRKIHEAEVPSPAVFDMIEIGGCKGIILQRIFGKSMWAMLVKEPWRFYSFVQQLAGFQHKIHKFSHEGLPSQKEKFSQAIILSSGILGDKAKKIIDFVDKLPEGDSICHGDLHLGNIIVSNDKLVALDWSGAYSGDPLGDVARTCLLINTPAIPPGIPDIVGTVSAFSKWMTCWLYLIEYIGASKANLENLDAWMLPVAAARLRARIPGEEKWLMGIINKRLEQLKLVP
ncbi:aminoglycoside phosphotransferase family protein [Desulfosporosinus sp. BG]|uniref:phosphotransferase family protein n=1 Tax=Desulfosporosinus sp. BG TaxID=1633135 RepID=UPI00083B4071|nr:aminoglycoside phosphotransferase family protein [Desulfosporosinus sp. BG]ODA40012.1 aminoglycoside phosphotransferase [Desulfosporosinus sp. BG]